MLISPLVWRALIDAGVMVLPLDAERVELRQAADSATVRVLRSPVPLNPSDVAALAGRQRETGLLILPTATPATRDAVELAGWSWLTDDGRRVTGVLQIVDRRIELDGGSGFDKRGLYRKTPGRVPWGALTVVRRLIERSYVTQRELAALAGVSQPRVSQTLRALADRRLVERTATGWSVPDFDQLVRWWLDVYPGPGGFTTFWYGLDQPGEQAHRILGLLDTAGTAAASAPSERRPHAVLSGDVAADLIAPWRTPNRAVIYARGGLDLTEAGLIPAGEEDATLEFVVPKDPGVWPVPATDVTWKAPDGRLPPLADSLQILWDVERSPSTDTDEAVARLWRRLRDRAEHTQGGHAA